MTMLLLSTEATKGDRSYNIWMTDMWELKTMAAWRILQIGTALIPSLPFNNISSAYLLPSSVCVPVLSLARGATLCSRPPDE